MLQSEHRQRRESVDSVTGYITPSISSLNTVSPLLQSHQNQPQLGQVSEDEEKTLGTPLTKDALQKTQLEQVQMSPELSSTHFPPIQEEPALPSTQRKRRRSSGLEIPASPEKTRQPPEKKRNTKTKAFAIEIIASQASKILETPQKERESTPELAKIPDSPKLQEEPVEKSKNARNRRNSKASGTVQEPAEISSTSEPTAPEEPAKPAATAKKGRKGTKSQQSDVVEEAPATEKEPPKSTADNKPKATRGTRKPSVVEKPPPVAEPSTNLKASASKAAAKKKGSKVNGDQDINKAAAEPKSTGPRKSKPIVLDSSATSQTSSSGADVAGDVQGPTSPSSTDSSASNVSGSNDQKIPKSPTPARAGRRQLTEESLRELEKSTDPAPEEKDVSRSSSPASSRSSSSDSSSDSSESDSESDSGSVSRSEVASVSAGSDKGSNAVTDESESESRSSSSDSDSDSDKSNSSSAKSVSKSRSVSPSSNASSAKSSQDDSSNSSRLVALALGGQPSKEKLQPVDPIIHRTILTQETDRSPNNTPLSQQSPLAPFATRENSKLQRWNSLSDFAKKIREEPKKTVPAKRKVQKEKESESESESESSSDSDSDASDKEDMGGIPKEKLAGRAPVAKKRKSGGLRSMFK